MRLMLARFRHKAKEGRQAQSGLVTRPCPGLRLWPVHQETKRRQDEKQYRQHQEHVGVAHYRRLQAHDAHHLRERLRVRIGALEARREIGEPLIGGDTCRRSASTRFD